MPLLPISRFVLNEKLKRFTGTFRRAQTLQLGGVIHMITIEILFAPLLLYTTKQTHGLGLKESLQSCLLMQTII